MLKLLFRALHDDVFRSPIGGLVLEIYRLEIANISPRIANFSQVEKTELGAEEIHYDCS